MKRKLFRTTRQKVKKKVRLNEIYNFFSFYYIESNLNLYTSLKLKNSENLILNFMKNLKKNSNCVMIK